MKKLSTLITALVIVISTAAMAQDHQPIRAQDGTGTDTFGVPARMREDAAIQDCVGEYQATRNAFQAEMLKLRQQLVNASAEDQAAIREQIKQQLKVHRVAQSEFRKQLKGVMGEMRKLRMAGRTSTGG